MKSNLTEEQKNIIDGAAHEGRGPQEIWNGLSRQGTNGLPYEEVTQYMRSKGYLGMRGQGSGDPGRILPTT